MAKSVKLAVILIILSLVINLGVNIFDLIFNKLAMLDLMLSTIFIIFQFIIIYFLCKGSLIARRFYLGLNIFIILCITLLFVYIYSIPYLYISNFFDNLRLFDTLQTVIFTVISLYLLFIPQDAKSFFSK